MRAGADAVRGACRCITVIDGRVVMSLSGSDDVVAPMEAYVELNGEPVDRGEGGLLTEQGWITRVNPGDVVLLDVGLQGTPERADRIVVCNLETTKPDATRPWLSSGRGSSSLRWTWVAAIPQRVGDD